MLNYEKYISGESPFKPELDGFVSHYPSRGTLKVQVTSASGSFPVKDAFVEVAVITDGKRYSIYHDVTDESGIVDNIILPCCVSSENNSPETAGKDNAEYYVSVFHPDFEEVTDVLVVAQEKLETILPVALEPINRTEDNNG